jgi:hypothetical protein
MPPMETLSLFRSQESQEETDLRKELGLRLISEPDPYPEQTEQILQKPAKPVSSEGERPSAPRPGDPIHEFQSHALANPPQVAASSQLQIPPERSITQPAQILRQNDIQKSEMPASDIGTVASTRSSSMRQPPLESTSTMRSIETESATNMDNLDEEEEIPSINMDSDSDQEMS